MCDGVCDDDVCDDDDDVCDDDDVWLSLQWMPEIMHHCPGARVLLIGTQSDRRQDPVRGLPAMMHGFAWLLTRCARIQMVVEELRTKNQRPITYAQGLQLAKDTGCSRFVECSAYTLKGVQDVFAGAVRLCREPREKPRRRVHSLCSIM
jgi:hypothetical protein